MAATIPGSIHHRRKDFRAISLASVCRYAQAYLAEHEALMLANANLQRMMEEVSKYPDLDTTEAIIRIVSHNLLNVLSNTMQQLV